MKRWNLLSGFLACLTCLVLLVPTQVNSATIRICYPNKAQYAPFIIARETDAWKKSGLEVREIVFAGGGIHAAEALIAGGADIAAMGDVPALIALGRNENFHILSSYMYSERMHRVVVSGASGIYAAGDLKGKKMAVQMGTSTHGGLLLYLKQQGIDTKDLLWVPIPPQHFPEAIQSGEVDAIAGSEPWPQNVLDKNPTAYQLTDFSGLGNSFPHVILVSNDFLKAHPQEVATFLQVIAESIAMLRKKPQEAAVIIAGSTGRTWQKEFAANAEMVWELSLDQRVENSLIQTAGFLFTEGRLKKMPDIARAMEKR